MFGVGYNNYGALGLGDTESRFRFSNHLGLINTIRLTPSLILGDLSSASIAQMSFGTYHSLFLLAGGRVFVSGGDSPTNRGLLGLGDTVNRCRALFSYFELLNLPQNDANVDLCTLLNQRDWN